MGKFEEKEGSTTIHVEGMTCLHCKKRVTKALKKVEGVKTVKVSLSEKEAEVGFEGVPVDEELLVKAVEDAGYRVGSDENSVPKNNEKSMKRKMRLLMGGGIGFVGMVVFMIVMFIIPGFFGIGGMEDFNMMLIGIPIMLAVMITMMLIIRYVHKRKT